MSFVQNKQKFYLKNKLIPDYLLFMMFKTLVKLLIQQGNISNTKFVTFCLYYAIFS